MNTSLVYTFFGTPTQYMWIRGMILVIFRLLAFFIWKLMEIIYVSKMNSSCSSWIGEGKDLLPPTSHLSVGGPLRAQLVNHCTTHCAMVGLWGSLVCLRIWRNPEKMDTNTYTHHAVCRFRGSEHVETYL